MRRFTGGRRAIVGAVLLAGLAGCADSGGAGSATTTTGQQDRTAVLREAIQCVRENGMPNLPDPQIDSNGEPQFPAGTPDPPERALRACRSIFERLESAAPGDDANPAAVPSLVRFAECLRQHGFPNFPDPRSDGNFPVDALPQGAKPDNPPFDAAIRACRQLNPDPNGDIHVR
jgi:hypothetical protein